MSFKKLPIKITLALRALGIVGYAVLAIMGYAACEIASSAVLSNVSYAALAIFCILVVVGTRPVKLIAFNIYKKLTLTLLNLHDSCNKILQYLNDMRLSMS